VTAAGVDINSSILAPAAIRCAETAVGVADAGCWVTYTRLIMSRRIPQLDGLRALAIIAVFLGHALKIRMMWMGG
jgi:hypothetical protein